MTSNSHKPLMHNQVSFVSISYAAPSDHASSSQSPARHEGEGDAAESGEHARRQKAIDGSREFVQQNTGLLLVIASQAFFSLMDAGVKRLHRIDPPVTTLQLIIVRMGITFICCLVYMLIAGIPNPILGPKGVRLLLVSRGTGGFFGLFGIYFSLKYLSLSDAIVLTFLSPTSTAIAGSILLGETFTVRQALAGMFSLAGVILIARPAVIFGGAYSSPEGGVPTDRVSPADRLLAVGVALIGVLGATMAYTSIRAVGKRAHAMHSMVFLSMICVAVSSLGMFVTNTAIVVPRQLDWLALLLMIGVFGFLGQLLLTMGLQRETAGRASMGIYIQVVFAIILEYIFFHTVPQFLSIIGMFMIIISAVYVALTKGKGQTSSSSAKGKSVVLPKVSEEEGGLERGLLSHSALQNSYNGSSRANTHED
ncbi:hypothetical protein GALMADRAFT_252285 [Galerina marginata CBS 339.88]|uniref:EamA domain-containing protein n=1 Tax=Galerina marginata (strain CBS 339.88) TaxID=685588 RepID=A0A067SSE3_GALM3|nr:hypothetical protein GALMADRAFT_252285 [Galerina marginata CBS 339.88]